MTDDGFYYRDEEADEEEGNAGVREPRKPSSPHDSASAALEVPHADELIVVAV